MPGNLPEGVTGEDFHDRSDPGDPPEDVEDEPLYPEDRPDRSEDAFDADDDERPIAHAPDGSKLFDLLPMKPRCTSCGAPNPTARSGNRYACSTCATREAQRAEKRLKGLEAAMAERGTRTLTICTRCALPPYDGQLHKTPGREEFLCNPCCGIPFGRPTPQVARTVSEVQKLLIGAMPMGTCKVCGGTGMFFGEHCEVCAKPIIIQKVREALDRQLAKVNEGLLRYRMVVRPNPHVCGWENVGTRIAHVPGTTLEMMQARRVTVLADDQSEPP